MDDNVELFIGICTTKEDFEKYKNSLYSSLMNIYSAFNGDCLVYIVVQSGGYFDTSSDFLDEEWIVVENTQYMGVSNARNMCIDIALENSSKFIIFHDASIHWSRSAAEFVYANKEINATPCVKVLFADDFNISGDLKSKTNEVLSEIKNNNPIYNSFVWSYLFRLDAINLIRFNLSFGPGQYTKFKSGEDVLFLFEYFTVNRKIIVPKNGDCCVIHPPRPTDYSKHLLYAYGQGALFRKLLNKHYSIQLLADIMLFFGNAIFRCITFRKNAFPILIGRLKGFIGV